MCVCVYIHIYRCGRTGDGVRSSLQAWPGRLKPAYVRNLATNSLSLYVYVFTCVCVGVGASACASLCVAAGISTIPRSCTYGRQCTQTLSLLSLSQRIYKRVNPRLPYIYIYTCVGVYARDKLKSFWQVDKADRPLYSASGRVSARPSVLHTRYVYPLLRYSLSLSLAWVRFISPRVYLYRSRCSRGRQ